MRVTVNYFGQLRQLAGVASESAEPPEGTSVQDCLKDVADSYGQGFVEILFGEEGRLRRTVMVLVNDTPLPRDAPRTLNDGDEVTLLTAIAGG